MADVDDDGVQAPPLIAPVTEPTDEQAEVLAKTDLGGGPANVFKTMAHNPRLLKRFNVLGGYFLAHGTISPRAREILVLRTAYRTGCDYEFGRHTLIVQRDNLLSSAELQRIASDPISDGWTDEERLLIRLADELDTKDRATADTLQELSSTYTNDQLIELVLLVGFYRMLAGFLNTVQVNRESGVPGWPS